MPGLSLLNNINIDLQLQYIMSFLPLCVEAFNHP